MRTTRVAALSGARLADHATATSCPAKATDGELARVLPDPEVLVPETLMVAPPLAASVLAP